MDLERELCGVALFVAGVIGLVWITAEAIGGADDRRKPKDPQADAKRPTDMGDVWGVLALLSLFGGSYCALNYFGWWGALAAWVLFVSFGRLEGRARKRRRDLDHKPRGAEP